MARPGLSLNQFQRPGYERGCSARRALSTSGFRPKPCRKLAPLSRPLMNSTVCTVRNRLHRVRDLGVHSLHPPARDARGVYSAQSPARGARPWRVQSIGACAIRRSPWVAATVATPVAGQERAAVLIDARLEREAHDRSDTRHGHQALADLILARDPPMIAIKQSLLLAHHIACLEQWLDRRAQVGRIGKQCINSGWERATVNGTDLEAVHLQQASNGVLDGQHVIDELLTRDERRAQQLRRLGLHMHGPVVPKAHHVGNAARVTAVGFVGARRQEPLRVPGLNANRLEPTFNQCTVEPLRQRARLDADERDLSAPPGDSAFISGTGSLRVFRSQTTDPSALTMQIDTVFSDTSSPT